MADDNVIPLVGTPGAIRSHAQVEWLKVRRRLERRGFTVKVLNGAIVLGRKPPRSRCDSTA